MRYARRHLLGLAFLLISQSASAEVNSPMLDLRNSLLLDGSRRITEHRLSIFEAHCKGRVAALDATYAIVKRRLTEHASRIDALVVKNRVRAEQKIGDAAEDLFIRTKKSQDELVEKFRSTYYRGGAVSASACSKAMADGERLLEDFDDLVPSIEENSTL